jgi:predicted MFS family arabinose efflux permease
MTGRAGRPVTVTAVFAVAEYRALWGGALISRVGDQLARVALALLVFHRSGSPFLTAVTYALTMLPALLGGPLLGGLADRYPRRELIVVCNLARAAMSAVMAVPTVPFGGLCALVFAAQILDSPGRAAGNALIAQVLPGEAYPFGVAVNQATYQVTLLVGFSAGGVIVTAIGPYPALAVNAATFVCCALVTGVGLRRRPAPSEHAPARSETGARGGFKVIAGTPRLRMLVALALLAGFTVIPEGLVVPYARQIGMPTSVIGLLFTAIPAGSVIGMLLLGRLLRPEAQIQVMGPLAVLSGLPLIVCALRPGAIVSVGSWALSGLLGAYQVTAQAEFVRLTPDHQRGRALGVASSALTAIQGIGVIIGGAIAEPIGAATSIALAGLANVLVGLPLAIAWRRIRSPSAQRPPAAPSGESRDGSDRGRGYVVPGL